MTTIYGMAPNGAGLSAMSTGQGACAPDKWVLLRAVEDIREPLGMKSTTLNILRALVSFLPGRQIDDTTDPDHICFASNDTLAARAHVSVQTVERHVSKLVDLGLIQRRVSGNGKRWARRDGQGRVTVVSGLSLTPLIERHAEFLQAGQAYQAALDELQALKDRCKLALAELVRAGGCWDDLVTKARNLLRRRMDRNALTALLHEICGELGGDSQNQTRKLRGKDEDIEGQKETDPNQIVKEEDSSNIRISADQMESAYPTLCTELRFSRDQQDCQNRMYDLAVGMGLASQWQEIVAQGSAKQFMVLGYLLERLDHIENPPAYTRYLLRKLTNGDITSANLLTKRPSVSHGHSKS